MARPKSSDKHTAILEAAITLVARQGDSAPTAKMALAAGVAEGTLFTYFPNKDALRSGIYTTLAEEVTEAVVAGFPTNPATRLRLNHAWSAYLKWGTKHRERYNALTLLAVSERVSAETKAEYRQAPAALQECIRESMDSGILREMPQDFVYALLLGMADTTLDFMWAYPKEASKYHESGFEAFWKAVAWE